MRISTPCPVSKVLACLFTSVLLSWAAYGENGYREWTSADGRTLSAEVLSIDESGETISLKRSDGLEFSIEWSRLSQADVDWIKARIDEERNYNPFEAPKPAEAVAAKAPAQDLPNKFKLKDVPMITQKENYCVPASASMIAGFHGVETDQDQVAKLSSSSSENNTGTYTSDMILAMEKLGFQGRPQSWQSPEEFSESVLPEIRRALVEIGPIYVSFKPGVFGEMGHGCVIVGYDDRKEELNFYNPWGEEFDSGYDLVAIDSNGVVYVDPPKEAPVADRDTIEFLQSKLPSFSGDVFSLVEQLKQIQVPHNLVWCSREDERANKRFSLVTARKDGRRILELAFERNPAVLIPHSSGGRTDQFYLVTRPPEGGSRFQVYTISEDGWNGPELFTITAIARNWATIIEVVSSTESLWDLPLIELGAAD